MSKIHVLGASPIGQYRVVIHTPIPAGSNSAGVLWKDAWLAALPRDEAGNALYTTLPEGVGVGQITTTERNQLVAGTLMELVTTILVESSGATATSVEEMVDAVIAQRQTALAVWLKYYGYTQG